MDLLIGYLRAFLLEIGGRVSSKVCYFMTQRCEKVSDSKAIDLDMK